MKKVFVVDDHVAIREGFRAILERSGRYKVSGEASDGDSALALLAQAAEKPDFFIVDVSLPGKSGLELLREFAKHCPGVPALVVSMHRRYDYIAGAFRAGASAYVSKDSGSDSVILALDAVGNGAYYLDPASLKLFVDEAAANPLAGQGGRLGAPNLSEREKEVLRLFSAGRRAEEIAAELALSQKTVENHLSNITSKLGARDRYELLRIAGSVV